jgi:Ferritin-like domain
MTETAKGSGVSRVQFLRNSAKGGIALMVGGGVLASVQGVAFASAASSDVSTLKAAYAAESLAVYIYRHLLAGFHSFKHPRLTNIDYFRAALRNEEDHKAFLGSALGANAPSGLRFRLPASVLRNGESVLKFGVTLEQAFVETYLGAVDTLSSTDLKLAAAKIASNEATHYSFFDAAAGGHAVLPSLPATITIPQAATALSPYIPDLTARLSASAAPRLGNG